MKNRRKRSSNHYDNNDEQPPNKITKSKEIIDDSYSDEIGFLSNPTVASNESNDPTTTSSSNDTERIDTHNSIKNYDAKSSEDNENETHSKSDKRTSDVNDTSSDSEHDSKTLVEKKKAVKKKSVTFFGYKVTNYDRQVKKMKTDINKMKQEEDPPLRRIKLAQRKLEDYTNLKVELIKRRCLSNVIKKMNCKDRPKLQECYDNGQTSEQVLREYINYNNVLDPVMVTEALTKAIPDESLCISFRQLLNDESAWNKYYGNPPTGVHRIPWEKFDLAYTPNGSNMRTGIIGMKIEEPTLINERVSKNSSEQSILPSEKCEPEMQSNDKCGYWFATRIPACDQRVKLWERNLNKLRQNPESKRSAINLVNENLQYCKNIKDGLLRRRFLSNIIKKMNCKDRPKLQECYDNGQTSEQILRDFMIQKNFKDPSIMSTALYKSIKDEKFRKAFEDLMNDGNAWNIFFSKPPDSVYNVPWETFDLSYQSMGVNIVPGFELTSMTSLQSNNCINKVSISLETSNNYVTPNRPLQPSKYEGIRSNDSIHSMSDTSVKKRLLFNDMAMFDSTGMFNDENLNNGLESQIQDKDSKDGKVVYTIYENINRDQCTIIPMKGDGNCLFRSVLHQIGKNPERHADLRDEVMNYIVGHESIFIPYFTDASDTAADKDDYNGNFGDYIQKTRKNGSFAGNMELFAVSKILKVIIMVYNPHGEYIIDPRDDDGNIDGMEEGPLNIMRLSYHGNNHYNSVVPKSEEQRIEGKNEKDIVNNEQLLNKHDQEAFSISEDYDSGDSDSEDSDSEDSGSNFEDSDSKHTLSMTQRDDNNEVESNMFERCSTVSVSYEVDPKLKGFIGRDLKILRRSGHDTIGKVKAVFKLLLPSEMNMMQLTFMNEHGQLQETTQSVEALIQLNEEAFCENRDLISSSQEPNDKFSTNEFYDSNIDDFKFDISNFPEFSKVLDSLTAANHYVYELWLTNENNEYDRCFYKGRTRDPNQRYKAEMESDNDVGEYFKKYPGRIRMVILFKGSFMECDIIEHLHISNKLDPFVKILVNKQKTIPPESNFKCDIATAMHQMRQAAFVFEPLYCDESMKFDQKDLDGFNLNTKNAPELQKLLDELNKPDHKVYLLCIIKNGQIEFSIYYGLTYCLQNRAISHTSIDCNVTKLDVIAQNRCNIYMIPIFRGLHGICELIEQLFIQWSSGPHYDKLTNTSKKHWPEIELDIDADVKNEALLQLYENAVNGPYRLNLDNATLSKETLRRSSIQKKKKYFETIDTKAKIEPAENCILNLRTLAMNRSTYEECTKEEALKNQKKLCKLNEYEPGSKVIVKEKYRIHEARTLVGTFKNMQEGSIKELIAYKDKLSPNEDVDDQRKRLCFLSKVGLVQNESECGCKFKRTFYKNNKQTAGFAWQCRDERNHVSTKFRTRVVLKHSIFYYIFRISFQFKLQALYLTSINTPPTEIPKLTGEPSNHYQLYVFAIHIRKLIAEEYKDATMKDATTEEVLELFFKDDIDRLGLLLFWLRTSTASYLKSVKKENQKKIV